MNKTSILIISCLMLSVFAVPSMAIVSPTLSYISNDQIMSSNLQQGKIDVSAKVEYWDAYEAYMGNTDYVMEPMTKAHFSYPILSIPLRLSYGLTDNTSIRVSMQYIKRSNIYNNFAPYEYIGYGMGDSKIEMIYQIAKEINETPSIAVNVGADILSGVNADNLPKPPSDTTLATGLTAPSYYLSGIFGKKMGAWDSKTLIGYIVTSPRKVGSDVVDPADQYILSYCISTAVNDTLEYGGEISAKFSGEDNLDLQNWLDPNDNQAHTPITRISVAPFVVINQSSNLSWKGVLEIPLAMKGNVSQGDMLLNQLRGTSVSIGGNWTI